MQKYLMIRKEYLVLLGNTRKSLRWILQSVTRQNNYISNFFRYVGDFLNVLNRPPTSQTCHQQIWSLTSVTNIDVTHGLLSV